MSNRKSGVAGIEVHGIPGGLVVQIVWAGPHDLDRAAQGLSGEAMTAALDRFLSEALAELRRVAGANTPQVEIDMDPRGRKHAGEA